MRALVWNGANGFKVPRVASWEACGLNGQQGSEGTRMHAQNFHFHVFQKCLILQRKIARSFRSNQPCGALIPSLPYLYCRAPQCLHSLSDNAMYPHRCKLTKIDVAILPSSQSTIPVPVGPVIWNCHAPRGWHSIILYRIDAIHNQGLRLTQSSPPNGPVSYPLPIEASALSFIKGPTSDIDPI